MDPRELNGNVRGAKDAGFGNEKRFIRTFIRQDLRPLRECRERLSEAERKEFRERYGTLDSLIDVEVDEDAIRAAMGFFDPRHRCFILPNLDLAITVEEYQRLTDASWVIEGPEPYIPNLDDLAAKGDTLKPRLQRLGMGISHTHMQGALRTINGKAYLNWSRMFQNMGTGWEKVLTSTARINFFTLGLFGLVLFPFTQGLIESRVVDLVSSQAKSVTRNVMPMVVAETLRSCVYMGQNREATFKCCTQLFTLWIHSHLTFEKSLKCDNPYDIKTDHILKFKDQGRRNWDEEA